MSYKVVYFSRTGGCKKIAKDIGKNLNLPVIEVKDDKNWSGIFGWFKAGYFSTREKLVNIKVSEPLKMEDNLIVVTPLWAGKITPAIRTVLKKFELDRIDLVVSSKGSRLKERRAYNAVYDVIENKNNKEEVIEQLIREIKTR
ncbi:MAG: hypothetical protein U9N10_11575 [Bacillota bacterium]|nr:hypothetical protein [Bacillota bacterium]